MGCHAQAIQLPITRPLPSLDKLVSLFPLLAFRWLIGWFHKPLHSMQGCLTPLHQLCSPGVYTDMCL
jgi:hypothetical protein